MFEHIMSREQLLQECANAYERLMETATEAGQRGVTRTEDGWGPREIVAHLAGWEVMATVRIPAVVGGMAPLEFADEAQTIVMDDAINSAFAMLAGDQPLAALCAKLRRAYQHNIEFLKTLDDRFFQPGEYVYERTKGVFRHCQEHIEMLVPAQP